MVKYRFAKNSQGEIIKAESLRGQKLEPSYRCLACAKPLVARVNGDVQRPHFGHKAKIECNNETYLHSLAKEVFAKTYLACLQDNEPFLIELEESIVCSRFRNLTGRNCYVEEDVQVYDLTNYYTEVKVETPDGRFIPDVSLHSRTIADELVYIEIAVTHFLSEDKSLSGKRIIEIPIKTEDDIDLIRAKKLTPKNVNFIGFTSKKAPVLPSGACKCAKQMAAAFIIHDSGKVYLDHTTLSIIQEKLNRRNFKYVNCVEGSQHDFDLGQIFYEQVLLAHERGVRFKNCYLCRFQGDNWSYDNTEPRVFCKLLKKPCTSNEAVSCPKYWLREELAK